MNEIKQAENFDKDLEEILGIVDYVEKDLQSKDFDKEIRKMRTLHNALNMSMNLSNTSIFSFEKRKASLE